MAESYVGLFNTTTSATDPTIICYPWGYHYEPLPRYVDLSLAAKATVLRARAR